MEKNQQDLDDEAAASRMDDDGASHIPGLRQPRDRKKEKQEEAGSKEESDSK